MKIAVKEPIHQNRFEKCSGAGLYYNLTIQTCSIDCPGIVYLDTIEFLQRQHLT